MTSEQIEYMVQRFLGWHLPENFNPDDGISFKRDYTAAGHPMKHEPTGTNLFDYGQAKEMIRYLVDGMPVASAPSPEELAREILTQLIIAGIRLAIMRWDLRDEEGMDLSDEECAEIAKDAAWACQGEGTCDESPIEEWNAVAALLRSHWGERPLVLGQYCFCPQCGAAATYQTPDGTLWDGMAHHWRLDMEASPNLDKAPGGKGDCVGCGKRTEYCCPFCKIKRGQIHWLCESPECREKHAQVSCARTPLPPPPGKEKV